MVQQLPPTVLIHVFDFIPDSYVIPRLAMASRAALDYPVLRYLWELHRDYSRYWDYLGELSQDEEESRALDSFFNRMWYGSSHGFNPLGDDSD
jgi:hypothetical protein